MPNIKQIDPDTQMFLFLTLLAESFRTRIELIDLRLAVLKRELSPEDFARHQKIAGENRADSVARG